MRILRSGLAFVLAALALATLAGAGGPAEAQSGKKRSTVTVVNRSEWAIFHLYLSSVDDDDWGPDQLGKDVIRTGGSFKLTNIPCDTYDVKLVDEDGDECVVMDVDICGGSDRWEITSRDLLACQAGDR